MPYIVVKAYPKDEAIKKAVAEDILRSFTEKWGCAAEAVTVKFEEYVPEDWQRQVKEQEIDPHADEMTILSGKMQG